MVVLEELDAHKKGLSEASRNVRQISRFLDDMIRGATKEHIDRGLPLPSADSGNHGEERRAAGSSSRPASLRARCRQACPDRAPTTRSWRRPSRS